MQVNVSFIAFVLCRNKLSLSLQELSFHFHLCWSHQLAQMDIEFNYEAVFPVRRTENSAMFSNEFGTGSKPVGIVLQAWVEPRFGWFYAFESQFAKLLKWALPNMWVSPERFHLSLWRTCCEHLCPIIQPGITFLHGVVLSSVINPPTGSFTAIGSFQLKHSLFIICIAMAPTDPLRVSAIDLPVTMFLITSFCLWLLFWMLQQYKW